MSNWIVRANPDQFRIHDFIRDYGFVEYRQTNKWEESDIIYLYITGEAKRVEYKMIVERANIPYNEAFDDRDYSLLDLPTVLTDTDKAVRFKLLKRVEDDKLSYRELCNHGFVGKNGRPLPMTSNRQLSDESSRYIESYFK